MRSVCSSRARDRSRPSRIKNGENHAEEIGDCLRSFSSNTESCCNLRGARNEKFRNSILIFGHLIVGGGRKKENWKKRVFERDIYMYKETFFLRQRENLKIV